MSEQLCKHGLRIDRELVQLRPTRRRTWQQRTRVARALPDKARALLDKVRILLDNKK